MLKVKMFTDPINQMKPWLNKMSEQGYRLVSVNVSFYRFEKSDRKYFYDTQFIGLNPAKDNQRYIDMIQENNCRTLFLFENGTG